MLVYTYSSKPEQGHINILHIEDNAADRMLVRHFLSEPAEEFFHVRYADLFSSGLKDLRRFPPDVVLLDLNLPDSSGLETLTVFLKEAAAVPVIVMTSMVDDELAAEAVRRGARECLFKWSVSPESLTGAIRMAVKGTAA